MVDDLIKLNTYSIKLPVKFLVSLSRRLLLGSFEGPRCIQGRWVSIC